MLLFRSLLFSRVIRLVWLCRNKEHTAMMIMVMLWALGLHKGMRSLIVSDNAKTFRALLDKVPPTVAWRYIPEAAPALVERVLGAVCWWSDKECHGNCASFSAVNRQQRGSDAKTSQQLVKAVAGPVEFREKSRGSYRRLRKFSISLRIRELSGDYFMMLEIWSQR